MKTAFKKIASLLICLCLIISGMVITASAAEKTATLSFANKAQRTSFSTTQQVWEQNGITFTNNKSSSTTAVADYASPVRLYANSQIIVELASGTITKIVFDANSSSYATTLKNSIGSAATVSSDKVTVTGVNAASFTVTKLTAQVRLDSITVTYEEATTEPEPEPEPEPEQPELTGASYVKVTSAPADWSGTYLIVYEDTANKANGPVAFKGSLSSLDSAENGVAVTINNGVIAATTELNNNTFTIAKSGTGYSVKSASNKYIGHTSYGNGLSSSSSVIVNSVSLNADSTVNLSVVLSGGTITLKYNAASNQMRFRYYKSGQEAICLYKYEEAKTPVADMGNTSVDVKEDLSVNQEVTVKPENIEGKELVMHFTMNGVTTTVPCDPSQIVDNKVSFTFDNIGIQCMADEITAKLVTVENDKETEQATATFSVKAYAKAVLETSTDEATKKFVSDMLRYGAAAQVYQNYTASGLATDGLESLLVEGSSTEVPTEEKMSLTDNASADDVYFKGATVRFDNTNTLVIKLNAKTENTKVLVNGAEATLNGLECVITGLKATDYATKFTFELYEGDLLVQTLSYGINSYAFSKQTSTNGSMAALAKALYAYGASASTPAN